MNKLLLYISLWITGLLSVRNLPAQSNSARSFDTMQKTTNIIEIEGKLSKSNFPESLKMKSFTINNSSMELSNELLVRVPGLLINDYGVSGLKTVSMNGSNSKQILILLNGFPINSVSNGSSNFSFLPNSDGMEINVIEGGSSSIIGSNAMFGALNFNYSSNEDSSLFNFRCDYGSYNSFKILSKANLINTDEQSMNISFDGQYSKGNYPISIQNSEFSRNNADICSFKFLSQYETYNNNDIFKTILLFNFDNAGVPGPVLTNNEENSLAREKQLGFFLGSSYHIEKPKNNFGFKFNWRLENYKFSDSLNYILFPEMEYLSNDFRGLFYYYQDFQRFNLWLNAEANFSFINGNMLSNISQKFASQRTMSITARINTNIFQTNSDLISFDFASGLNFFSNFGASVYPMLGFIYRKRNNDFSVSLNSSYNFRIPSFNELYYLNYGNRELKPEKCYSVNSTINYNPLELINLSLSLYFNLTEDQIVAIPKSPVSWSATNYASVMAKGINISTKINIKHEIFSILANYNIQEVSDNNINSINYGRNIIYQPRESASLLSELKLNLLSIVSEFRYTGFRYTMPDNDNSSVLPSYLIFNFKISRKFDLIGFSLDAAIKCNNLMNEKYSTILNYPMIGRNFNFSINFKI